MSSDLKEENLQGEKHNSTTLKEKALKGSYMTFLGYGGEQTIRFFGNLIAAYFLTPEDFGINFYVILMLSALSLFSDIGLRPSVVRSARGDDQRFLNTAWSLQVIRGFTLFIFACVFAVPWSNFYETPILSLLVPVAALTAIFDGFASMKFLTASRHMDITKIVLIRIISQAVGLIIVIGYAYLTRSVWALVYGAIGASATKCLLTYVLISGPLNKPEWEPEALKELITFGRWIFISTALTWLASHGDGLLLGKLLSAETLGLFFIASQIALIPLTAFGNINRSIIFPIYSSVWRETRSLKDSFSKIRFPATTLAGWLFAVLIAIGANFIRGVYPGSYETAGYMVQFLVVGMWFLVLENMTGSALLAMGNSKVIAMGCLIKTILVFIGIYVGYNLAEIEGALLGIIFSELVRYVFMTFIAARSGLHAWQNDIGFSLYLLVTAGVGLLLNDEMDNMNIHPLLAVVISGIVVTFLWLPVLLKILKQYVLDKRSIAQNS